VHLRVAVLIDNVDPLVRSDEIVHFAIERIGTQAEIVDAHSVLGLQLIEGLDHRVVRGSIGDDADLVAVVAHDFRLGNQGARVFELARQTVHVVGVVVGTLAVLRLFVMTAAARKPRRARMIGPGNVR